MVLGRPITRALTALVLAASALVYVNPASADLARSGSTVLVSAFPDGTPADGGEPSVSADGRYVAFASWDKLLPDARDNCQSVYRKDMVTGELLLLTPGTCSSYLPSISADGNKVLYVRGFCRRDSVLLNNYCSGFWAYVRDIAAGTTVSISNPAWQVEYAKLSSNGNYAVLLQSDSWDVWGALVVDARVPFSWSNAWNIGGIGLSVPGYTADISADGRYAVFVSENEHVVQDADYYGEDVYLFDRVTSTITLVGLHPSGQARYSRHPSISADGSTVAFMSSEIPQSPRYGPVVGDYGIYGDFETSLGANVYTRRLSTGNTVLVSQSSSGAPGFWGALSTSLSGDGTLISIDTFAPLLSVDLNPLSDVFIRNASTGKTLLASVLPDGSQGVGFRWRSDLSDSGRFVAFESRIDPQLPYERRVYLRDLQPACSLEVCPLDYP